MTDSLRAIGMFLVRLGIAAAGFAAFLVFLCWVAAPDLDAVPDAPSLEEVARVAASRLASPSRDISKRPRIQKVVDYAEGPEGQWWPKGEPPILVAERGAAGRPTRLIEVDGKELAPVHRRTGPEPLVLVGVDDQARATPPDPVNRYGSTHVSHGSVAGLGHAGSASTLLRWSPQGDPVVPHVAKSCTAGLPDDVKDIWLGAMSPDIREAWEDPANRYAAFDLCLRQGMKWSDGKPYSVVDIMYWWWHETNNPKVQGHVREFIRAAGLPGRIWMYEIDENTGRQTPLYAKTLNPPPEIVEMMTVNGREMPVMRVRVVGEGGQDPVEKTINPYRFLVTFSRPMDAAGESGFDHTSSMDMESELPNPYGMFPRILATPWSLDITGSPAHYLWKYSPDPAVGVPAALEAEKVRRRVNSDKLLYELLKKPVNPECPRIWPWISRRYRAEPPQDAYRNPYYWAVDAWGNQLPYIDHLHFVHKTREMMMASAAAGEVPYAISTMREHVYELIMANRDTGHYDVHHWYRADRSLNTICFNLFRRVDPRKPETALKRKLLRDLRFRRAMSLAINRQEICDAEFYGFTEPCQCAPGPSSRFYYEHKEPLDPGDPYLREAYRSYTTYDVNKANELLDDTGLTNRDIDGFRTFANGTRLVLFVDTYKGASMGPLRLMCRHWAEVGVDVIPKIQESRLYWTRKDGLQHDMTMFPGEVEYEAILQPRMFVPTNDECNYAIPFARWYAKGGLRGKLDEAARTGALPDGVEAPPTDRADPLYPLRRTMEIYDEIRKTGDLREQERLFVEVQDIAARNLWSIAPCETPPIPVIIRKDFRNVPKLGVKTFNFLTPANAGFETFYFDRAISAGPDASDSEREWVKKLHRDWADWDTKREPDIRAAISTMTPVTPVEEAPDSGVPGKRPGRVVSRLVKALIAGVVFLFVGLIAVRHPYVARRLAIMVPTMVIISIIAFVAIQLPPGDFLTSMIMKYESIGEQADLEKIADLKEMFHLDESVLRRYCRWAGLNWFGTIRPVRDFPYLRGEDSQKGLLQGNLGRRMLDGRLVNDIVGDRILMTFLIALGSILLTWSIAIPIGIYSAVKQYSIGDYVFTFFGFVGMCVPSFLLAIVVMFLSSRFLHMDITGLLSPKYSAQAAWDWPKVLDLLKHIWVPILILTITGTAGMIRVMRGNLLDELKKPYVTTARAKGVRPLKLLLKYPVRLSLNPFVSGIGYVFPALLSGGTIVAVVLSLPTVGELMLRALQDEEMYIGGSMLVILSMLGIIGTLVSDLLLLGLDPRIRYGEGSR